MRKQLGPKTRVVHRHFGRQAVRSRMAKLMDFTAFLQSQKAVLQLAQSRHQAFAANLGQ